MRKADGSFSWSAYDPAHWTHFHHAGVQVHAYRIAPWRMTGAGLYETFDQPSRWWRVVRALITFNWR